MREFTCRVPQLETALTTLSLIAAAGNTLLDVYYLENGKRTNLPPQAFDQHDLIRPLQALQNQWEAILAIPEEKARALLTLSLLEMTLQRIDQYESQMAECDSSISKFEQLMATTQQTLVTGINRHRLLTHYRAIIYRQWVFCERAQAGRDRWLARLAELKRD